MEIKFNKIKLISFLRTMHAMLPMDVYKHIYDICYELKPKNIIEIGTAHGGATIAMAYGCKGAGFSPNIKTIDLLEPTQDMIGCSSPVFGDKSKNIEIINKNFKTSNVDDCIELFIGHSDNFLKETNYKDSIDLMFLDADGRIDRDILNFYHLFNNNTILIIDDINYLPKFTTTKNGKFFNLKHVISHKLLKCFMSLNYLKVEKRIQNTAFCSIKNLNLWNKGIIQELALLCYRDLVFTKL